jgi:hypothetical protein
MEKFEHDIRHDEAGRALPYKVARHFNIPQSNMGVAHYITYVSARQKELDQAQQTEPQS